MASLSRVGAEDEPDGGSFDAVVHFGRGAVGVDVADLLRGEAGIAQGHAHGARGALGGGLGDMAGVGGHAEADDLRDGPGAAGERGLERLEHQHGGAFAQYQSAAIARKGPAGVLADDPHGFPSLEIAEVERSLAAAGDGDRARAGAHHVKGLADGVPRTRRRRWRWCRTGPGCRTAWRCGSLPALAMPSGNGERMDAIAAVEVQLAVAHFLRGAAADAGASNDRSVLAHGRRQLQTGLRHRLLRRDDGELRKTVHQGEFLGGQMIFGDKALDVGSMFEAKLLEISRMSWCGCRICRQRASARRRPV